MQGHAHIIHLRPEAEAVYKKYHQAVWPDVLSKITDCNIRNYSIFLRDGEDEWWAALTEVFHLD